MTEIDQRRMARDAAESLWRQRSGSYIFTVTRLSRLVGCNINDHVLVNILNSLTERASGENFSGEVNKQYLHLILDSATSVAYPPSDGTILYVLRPARLNDVIHIVTAQASKRRFAIEMDDEVSFVYVY